MYYIFEFVIHQYHSKHKLRNLIYVEDLQQMIHTFFIPFKEYT